MIDPEDRLPRRVESVLGHNTSYVDHGNGPVIVFLHGIASYTYEWRNIIPFLAPSFRCIAPDLLGWGDSGRIKPSGPGSYRFGDIRSHLKTFLEILQVGDHLIVGRDLGALMAMSVAQTAPKSTRGLILIEPIVRRANTWTWPTEIQQLFNALTAEMSERTALDSEGIIRDWVQATTLRQLTQIELDAYRRPYSIDRERGRAMHTFLSALPVSHRTGPLDGLVDEVRAWISQSAIPKLVIGGLPGLLSPPGVLGVVSKWDQTSVGSVPGISHLCEDSPSRIAAQIASFASAV